MARKVTLDPASLTLRQFMVLFPKPPMYRPQDLVERSGLAQPRVSELLRGVRIYPAGIAQARAALGLEGAGNDGLFEALLGNSARAAAAGRVEG